MMVVSDTSPLCYLAELGQLDLLRRLYGVIHCPPEVMAECLHLNAPKNLREWAESAPEWLLVMGYSAWEHPALAGVDAGEAAAMRLYHDLGADCLLVDDIRARNVARELGIHVKGLVGILAEAAAKGWIDFDFTVLELRSRTNFRISDFVLDQVRAVLRGDPPA